MVADIIYNFLNKFLVFLEPILIVSLLGTGIYLTWKLRFIQFKGFKEAFYLAFIVRKEKGDSKGDINHFQALMTALSATVGTGNIVGVATAITLGGPGAIFWMWITGLVGMATKYSEAVLAIKYREKDERGEIAGGPMYYIKNGINSKALAIAFALFASISAFGIGNMVQANSLSSAMHTLFRSPHWINGIILAILTALIIIGGIKSIAKATSFLVPIMIVVYVIGSLTILIYHYDKIIPSLLLIIKSAFTPYSPAGGIAGYMVYDAIRKGVARGIFSNESGLGSSPIAAAAAKTKHSVTQALVSMTQTFIDTLIVCTMTALVIIISGKWLIPNLQGLYLTNASYSWGIPNGEIIVSFGLLLFAFSTIIGWYYYGERAIYFLLGYKAIMPYKILWVIMVFLGAMLKLKLVWTFSDVMNVLMAVPNLIALLFLANVIKQETEDYFKNYRKNI